MAADRFDVVVVGAGPAGCVLANRLTQELGRSVCVLEAGPDYGPDPAAWPADLRDPTLVWYQSHPWGYEHAGRPPLYVLADRDKHGPWGLFGGHDGRRAEYVLNPDGDARTLGSKTTIEVGAGDVVSYRTCGGGGYGPPEERDPEHVLRDVVEGKVSAARASELYGVAIVDGAVDEA